MARGVVCRPSKRLDSGTSSILVVDIYRRVRVCGKGFSWR